MRPQQQPTAPAPPPLWRGEYDRIYRLMTARLRAAAERRPAAADTAVPAQGAAP